MHVIILYLLYIVYTYLCFQEVFNYASYPSMPLPFNPFSSMIVFQIALTSASSLE